MAQDPTTLPPWWERISPAQTRLAAFIGIVAVLTVAYRVVYATGVQQTAALFVGLPALLAILLALLPTERTASGMLFKGTTIAMLIAGVILPEGLICLLFAWPLVIVAALVVGGTIDWAARRQRGRARPLAVVSLPLLLLSLEGVVDTPVDRHDRAAATITVEASAEEVAAALARPPTFDSDLPAFLAVGFNRPVGASGSGIDVGDARTIEFTGGSHDEHPISIAGLLGGTHDGHAAEPAEHPGAHPAGHVADAGEGDVSVMRLRVVESVEGRVVFAVEHDATMLSRWLDLDRAVVEWEPVDETRTRVSWSFEYERLLAPTFYFGPLQRYGMGEAAGYLLDAVITEQVR